MTDVTVDRTKKHKLEKKEEGNLSAEQYHV